MFHYGLKGHHLRSKISYGIYYLSLVTSHDSTFLIPIALYFQGSVFKLLLYHTRFNTTYQSASVFASLQTRQELISHPCPLVRMKTDLLTRLFLFPQETLAFREKFEDKNMAYIWVSFSIRQRGKVTISACFSQKFILNYI